MSVPALRRVIVLLTLLAAGCGTPALEPADRVLMNAAVYTVDAERSWAEAVAMADGRILFVGSNADVKALIDAETDVVDLQGQMVLPGFHDSHTHILVGIATDEECDLLQIPTAEEVVAKVRDCAALRSRGFRRP